MAPSQCVWWTGSAGNSPSSTRSGLVPTLEYLSYFMNRDYEQHEVYRFLDNLCYRREKGMTDEERIYQLGYTNPFSRKEETFILRSKHNGEVNELIRRVAAACDTE